MGNKSKQHHVALNAPKPVAMFVVFATNVHDQMAANATLFPAPPVPLAQLAAEISDLSAKQTIAVTKAVGAVAARNAAEKAVRLTLNALRAYVETVANGDPDHASEIAQKAGMSVRKSGAHPKSDLAVTHGATGEVKLAAKGIRGGRSHEWQSSPDGKTWSDLPGSLQATTHVKGLQPGATAYFRHRVLTKAGPQDWSQPVSVIVL
jgi:hypothetical protein